MKRVSLFVCLLLAAVVTLGSPRPSEAAGLASGHAVAVTADGSRVVVGGSNRALYEVDPNTLEVKRRVYLGRRVSEMAFTQDATRLWVESTKGIHILDGKTLEILETRDNLARMAVVPGLDRLVVFHRRRPTGLRVLDMKTGETLRALPVESRSTPVGFALSPDGSKVALLHGREKLESEPKVARGDVPKELRGAARNEFLQRKDGYGQRLVIFDMSSGEVVRETTSWFATSSGSHRLLWRGEELLVVTYQNQNARFDAKGEATYFELGNSYNYAHFASPDGRNVWSGGLAQGALTPAEGAATLFELPAPGGFPEYFKAFSLAKDGTAFAGTTAFRVARFDAKGKLVKVAAIY